MSEDGEEALSITPEERSFERNKEVSLSPPPTLEEQREALWTYENEPELAHEENLAESAASFDDGALVARVQQKRKKIEVWDDGLCFPLD